MTSISDFYAGRNLFVTGVTGFMGKVLVEKLLRSCPSIGKIYVLVRPKKGQAPHQRVADMLESKLFDKVRNTNPESLQKLNPIEGDILSPALGLSEADIELLKSEVSIVFHSAATVKFDEALKLSVQMNVIGTKELIKLCHKLTKLEALVHVSTAYANCDKDQITEQVYQPLIHPQKILDAMEWMDDDVVDVLTPKIIRPRPNTYTLTKAMAEYIFVEESRGLPVAIVRPSIVGSSWQEPMPGWVDNFNGPTGLLAAIGKGALRIMKGNKNGTADIIPVDLATNLMIATAWYTGIERPSSIKVYNCTTGQLNKLTWGQVERASYHYFMKHPLEDMFRLPHPRFTTSSLWYHANLYIDHLLPAWVMDFFSNMVGKKAIYTKIQSRLWKSVNSLEYFTSREWMFTNENVLVLQEKLSTDDRKEFNFDVKKIHWPTYLENYCIGTKRYALKEDLAKLPQARKGLEKLKRWALFRNIIAVLVFWRILMTRFSFARNLFFFLISWAVKVFKKIPSIAKQASA